ncbi:hypothetical protein D3C80_2069500 [compost metagenome]
MGVFGHDLVAAQPFRVVDHKTGVDRLAVLQVIRDPFNAVSVQHAAFLSVGIIQPAHGCFRIFGIG